MEVQAGDWDRLGVGQKAEEGRFRRFGGVVPRQGLSGQRRDWAGPTHLWGGENGKPQNRRAGHGSVGRPRRERSSPPARPN